MDININLSREKDIPVYFKEWKCRIVRPFPRYANDRKVLSLVDWDTGEPIALGSLNIPSYPLKEDHVIIKNYSENAGMLDSLMEAGIVSYPVDFISHGYIDYSPVCKLLIGNGSRL